MVTSDARGRLISAALSLFAERGFDGTSVGDIEAAAGFTRRGRAFYKHFASKDDVLVAALERHAAAVDSFRTRTDLLPLGDLRAELTLVCRWILGELNSERELIHVLERDGDRAPALRSQIKSRFVDLAAREGAAFIRRWAQANGTDEGDPEASAAVLIGSIVNYRRTEWTFGSAALEIDEDRFVKAWVATALALTTV